MNHLGSAPSFLILFLKHLFSLTSIHPNRKSYYGFSQSPGEPVTSVLPLGLPWLQTLALFQAALLHLNFNPVYGLSAPLASQRLWNYPSGKRLVTQPVIKASVRICVLQTCVCACERRWNVCLWLRCWNDVAETKVLNAYLSVPPESSDATK